MGRKGLILRVSPSIRVPVDELREYLLVQEQNCCNGRNEGVEDSGAERTVPINNN